MDQIIKKKKILIIIHGLGCGGAEKSLITFLNTLPSGKWSIDLIVANPTGIYMDKIPSYVQIIDNLYELENFSTEFKKRRKKICSIRDFFLQLNWQIKLRTGSDRNLEYGERKWKHWGRYLPKLRKKYDLAISYMNGFPNYYIIDKVAANKKIVWVHNEFEKMKYDYQLEYPFYQKADKIVTISYACADSIVRVFPDLKDKVIVLENISSEKSIRILANEKIEDPYFREHKLRLLSVGRLSEQKNFALAIEAAYILKKSQIDFLWYILGEGELRQQLQSKIDEYHLENYMKLVGIKSNPYPYIKSCEIFVQSSIFEGKSIVLDEAKILCKPIVVTNYTTVYNSIEDKKNGLIVAMQPESLAEAIQHLYKDQTSRDGLIRQLKMENNGNEREIEKYIQLFEECLREGVENGHVNRK